MRKFFKIGRLKALIAGGISRSGHLYAYFGMKTKKGLHGGVSLGTKGRQFYGGYSGKYNKIKAKYNLESKRTRVTLR
jgi:hypothetical protein